MWRALILWYWRQRLQYAREYRKGTEAVMRSEIAKAQYDVDYCEKKVQGTEIAQVVARTKRKPWARA